MINKTTQILFFILLICLPFDLYGQNSSLVIGTKIAEPFVYTNSDGQWSGLSFDLWKSICEEIGCDYDVKQYALDDLLDAVNKGTVDVAVAPLTITAEREAIMDFTQPYYVTGLGIAVSKNSAGSTFGFIKRFFSYEFFEIVLVLAVLLFVIGFITWLFERKKNAEQFGDGKTRGLGSSFWWAAVTMTTVGYGDKAPRTVGGRIIGLIWMFAAIIIISSFTAAIASALTADRLDSHINSVDDLKHVSVGTVANSSSENYLRSNHLNYIVYKTVDDAIGDLSQGKLDAVVHDAPILKYIIKKNRWGSSLSVLPFNLEPLYYGFAIPQGSRLREKINRVLIEKITSSGWKDVLYRYFGE